MGYLSHIDPNPFIEGTFDFGDGDYQAGFTMSLRDNELIVNNNGLTFIRGGRFTKFVVGMITDFCTKIEVGTAVELSTIFDRINESSIASWSMSYSEHPDNACVFFFTNNEDTLLFKMMN